MSFVPFWSPQSAVFLCDLPGFASPFLVRRMLSAGTPVDLVYRGDRMGPAIRDGAVLRALPLDGATVHPGDLALVALGGALDLLRVTAVGDRQAELRGDADPGPPAIVPIGEILTRVQGRERGSIPSTWRRSWRRFRLDVGEALRGGVDASPDPAVTVREKYDAQAPFYARTGASDVPPPLLARIGREVRAGGRIVVAGCGTGGGCFALAAAGFAVTGIDFSPAMVRIAREESERRGARATFVGADLRHHDEAPGSAAAVLFTYDTYSFLPRRAERIALLRRMVAWLEPAGVILLSARRASRSYERLCLTLQYAAALPRGARFGASHTRWRSTDGRMHRSFLQVFTPRQLVRETGAAGLRLGTWEGGHAVLRPG